MQKAILVARLLLGLIFTVFSLNYFVPFLPMPEMTESAGSFMGALAATGYMLPVVKSVELVAGVFLLLGVLVPLALTLLAPVVVNIVLVHLFLDPSGLPMGLLIVVLGLFLAYSYRGSFAGVLTFRADPG